MAPMRFRAVVPALVCCALSACGLYRAHGDLGDIGELANVTGTIEAPQGSTHPLFIGLFRDEAGKKSLAAYFV